jgi:hypothetical protein
VQVKDAGIISSVSDIEIGDTVILVIAEPKKMIDSEADMPSKNIGNQDIALSTFYNIGKLTTLCEESLKGSGMKATIIQALSLPINAKTQLFVRQSDSDHSNQFRMVRDFNDIAHQRRIFVKCEGYIELAIRPLSLLDGSPTICSVDHVESAPTNSWKSVFVAPTDLHAETVTVNDVEDALRQLLLDDLALTTTSPLPTFDIAIYRKPSNDAALLRRISESDAPKYLQNGAAVYYMPVFDLELHLFIGAGDKHSVTLTRAQVQIMCNSIVSGNADNAKSTFMKIVNKSIGVIPLSENFELRPISDLFLGSDWLIGMLHTSTNSEFDAKLSPTQVQYIPVPNRPVLCIRSADNISLSPLYVILQENMSLDSLKELVYSKMFFSKQNETELPQDISCNSLIFSVNGAIIQRLEDVGANTTIHVRMAPAESIYQSDERSENPNCAQDTNKDNRSILHLGNTIQVGNEKEQNFGDGDPSLTTTDAVTTGVECGDIHLNMEGDLEDLVINVLDFPDTNFEGGTICIRKTADWDEFKKYILLKFGIIDYFVDSIHLEGTCLLTCMNDLETGDNITVRLRKVIDQSLVELPPNSAILHHESSSQYQRPAEMPLIQRIPVEFRLFGVPLDECDIISHIMNYSVGKIFYSDLCNIVESKLKILQGQSYDMLFGINEDLSDVEGFDASIPLRSQDMHSLVEYIANRNCLRFRIKPTMSSIVIVRFVVEHDSSVIAKHAMLILKIWDWETFVSVLTRDLQLPQGIIVVDIFNESGVNYRKNIKAIREFDIVFVKIREVRTVELVHTPSRVQNVVHVSEVNKGLINVLVHDYGFSMTQATNVLSSPNKLSLEDALNILLQDPETTGQGGSSEQYVYEEEKKMDSAVKLNEYLSSDTRSMLQMMGFSDEDIKLALNVGQCSDVDEAIAYINNVGYNLAGKINTSVGVKDTLSPQLQQFDHIVVRELLAMGYDEGSICEALEQAPNMTVSEVVGFLNGESKQCPICLNNFCVRSMYTISCTSNHRLCFGCIVGHLKSCLKNTETTQMHIPACPMPKCNYVLDYNDLNQLIKLCTDKSVGAPLTIAEAKLLSDNVENLFLQKGKREARCIRCVKCSNPEYWFIPPEKDLFNGLEKQRVQCDQCKTDFCANCSAEPYHYHVSYNNNR